MKTVREVADILDIARQTVYSKMTDTFKEKYTSINDKGILVISIEGIEELKKNTVRPDSPNDSQETVQNDSR